MIPAYREKASSTYAQAHTTTAQAQGAHAQPAHAQPAQARTEPAQDILSQHKQAHIKTAQAQTAHTDCTWSNCSTGCRVKAVLRVACTPHLWAQGALET